MVWVPIMMSISPFLTDSKFWVSESAVVLSASKRAMRADLKSFLSSDSRSLVPKPLWIREP